MRNALYLNRIDNNLGDDQSSVWRQRDLLQQMANFLGLNGRELFPPGPRADFGSPEKWDLNAEIIIVGGGGLIGPPIFDPGWDKIAEAEGLVVLWGVGHNKHNGRLISAQYKKAINKLKGRFIHFSRDVCGQIFTPCPSIIKLIENFTTEKFKTELIEELFLEHATRKLPIRFNLPSFKLEVDRGMDFKFEQVVDAIQSSKVVTTNSYHGALWSLFFSKKVNIVDVFSDKFLCMPFIHNAQLGYSLPSRHLNSMNYSSLKPFEEFQEKLTDSLILYNKWLNER